jgi:[ribosomal protein S18]-alanine N-acetyltransferase
LSSLWKIRRLAHEEVEQVAAVLGLARLGTDGFYLVAWADGEPLGHAHLALSQPPELQDVSVRETHRRLGIASALTQAAEAEAAGRGFDRIRVNVSDADAAAQGLYRKQGYRDTGLPPKRIQGKIVIRTGPIEVDDTLLTWEKRLDRGSKSPTADRR